MSRKYCYNYTRETKLYEKINDKLGQKDFGQKFASSKADG
jgi:hypothetical protein